MIICFYKHKSLLLTPSPSWRAFSLPSSLFTSEDHSCLHFFRTWTLAGGRRPRLCVSHTAVVVKMSLRRSASHPHPWKDWFGVRALVQACGEAEASRRRRRIEEPCSPDGDQGERIGQGPRSRYTLQGHTSSTRLLPLKGLFQFWMTMYYAIHQIRALVTQGSLSTTFLDASRGVVY